MTKQITPAVWFPTIRAGSGSDTFTLRLVAALLARGFRAEICWLPHRAEYMPWSVRIRDVPEWANVVHINSWLPGRFIPKSLPVVVTLHSCVHDLAFSPYKSLAQSLYHRCWIRHCEIASIRRANVVTAVSAYTANQARICFNIDQIKVIYNWIDSKQFSPASRDVPRDRFRLLFVGNLNKRKGIDLLPEIMRRLGDSYQLYFTGESHEFMGCGELPENMIPLGRINSSEDIVAAYRSCDALLFPTRLEGFGLVALEAQACGVPVVATNSTSLPEVVEDGITGLLCNVDDVEMFVSAVQSLRGNPDLWLEMRDNARLRAIERFSEDEMVARYIALYQQLIAQVE